MAMLPKTYVEKELRNMKTKNITEREKQLMPDTMEAASTYKRYNETAKQAQDEVDRLKAQLNAAILSRDSAVFNMKRILNNQPVIENGVVLVRAADDDEEAEEADDEQTDAQQEDAAAASGSSSSSTSSRKKEIKYFKPCPKADCNGYLSTQWKCGICNVKVCKDCLEIKVVDEEHTCDPNDLASALEVKRNCKDCPKCHTKIYKVSGCAQMWCTSCHTAFDWNSLKIVTQGIHNPHYYEWMHRNGAGAGNGGNGANIDPTRQLQGGCGALAVGDILALNIAQTDKGLLSEYLRILIESQEKLLTDFHLPNTEGRNYGLRVQFIVGELDKAEYERQLFLADKKFLSTQDYNNLHTMLVDQGMATLRGLIERRGRDLVVTTNELTELRNFYGRQMEILNKKYKLKTRSAFIHFNPPVYAPAAMILMPEIVVDYQAPAFAVPLVGGGIHHLPAIAGVHYLPAAPAQRQQRQAAPAPAAAPQAADNQPAVPGALVRRNRRIVTDTGAR